MRLRRRGRLAAVDPNAPVYPLETPLWEGRASLALIVPVLLGWGLIVLVGLAWHFGWVPSGVRSFLLRVRDWIPFVPRSWWALWPWLALIPAADLLHQLVWLASIRYQLTREHLHITTGSLSRWTKTFELARVGSVAIYEPWYLRMVHRAVLILYPLDAQASPRIVLRGVRHPLWLRQTLQQLMGERSV